MNNPAYEIHCRYSLESRSAAAGIPLRTSIEQLQMERWYMTAVIPYHDYVVLSWKIGMYTEGDCSAAVYHFDSDDHTIEGPLTLVYLYYREFDDLGDATKTALSRAECLKADELMKERK